MDISLAVDGPAGSAATTSAPAMHVAFLRSIHPGSGSNDALCGVRASRSSMSRYLRSMTGQS
jgi:hypothetical protein